MRLLTKRNAMRRIGCAILGGAALVCAAQTAWAEDGDFFSSIFGGGNSQPAAPQVYEPAVPQELPVHRRPLTVKLHRPKVSHVARAARPEPGNPGKVSIFQDRTLRRGDAVMTAKGIRIFAGSSSWPYRDADFVAISAAGHMDKSYQRVLLDLDRLQRH